jgi:hypothetical protein
VNQKCAKINEEQKENKENKEEILKILKSKCLEKDGSSKVKIDV